MIEWQWLVDVTRRVLQEQRQKRDELLARLRKMSASVDLAEAYIRRSSTMPKNATPKIKRILLSGDKQMSVSGTEEDIANAARRMMRRTRACVTVAVVTGFYHTGDCDQRPARGGFDPAGN